MLIWKWSTFLLLPWYYHQKGDETSERSKILATIKVGMERGITRVMVILRWWYTVVAVAMR